MPRFGEVRGINLAYSAYARPQRAMYFAAARARRLVEHASSPSCLVFALWRNAENTPHDSVSSYYAGVADEVIRHYHLNRSRLEARREREE